MVKFIKPKEPVRIPKKARSKAQKAAEAEALSARAENAKRRLETRRKVVIGGALIALAEHDRNAAKLLAHIKRNLTRPADRKLFEDGT